MLVPGLSRQEKRLNICSDTKEVVTGRTLKKFWEFELFEILSPLSIRLRGKYSMRFLGVF